MNIVQVRLVAIVVGLACSPPRETTDCSPRIRSTYDKRRGIPLSEPVELAIATHLQQWPPREITLPWNVPGGTPTVARLIVTSVRGVAVAVSDFNRNYWKAAFDAASVPSSRYENGMLALRHFFASSLLDQRESIKRLSSG